MTLAMAARLGIAAGATMLAVGTVFHFSIGAWAPSIQQVYVQHPELFRPWEGWTRSYMALHPLGYGFIFAYVYRLCTASSASIAPDTRRGVLFGFLVFLVGSFPVFMLTHASIRMPEHVVVVWTLQNLVQYLAAGAVIGTLASRKRPRRDTAAATDPVA